MDSEFGSGNELANPQSYAQVNPTELCWCKGATNLMEVKWVQDLVVLLKSSVREEVEDALKRLIVPHLSSLQTPALPPTPRSLANLAECPTSSSLQLHFVGTLLETLLTLNNIQVEGGSKLMVELRDSSGLRVEVGPESSAKIQIVALDGDFKIEDRDHWSDEAFNTNVVSQREGRRPLLVGKCEFSLSKGVGIVGDISFTDNSKWIKCGKFRLGAHFVKGQKGLPPGIRPAVSRAFRVKERRIKAYEKRKTPNLEDNIWRLDNIAKNGQISRRLEDANIHTVKDFLQLYHTNAKRLEEILHVSEKKWKAIVENAKSCLLTNEHYGYNDDAMGAELVLDCVFNIVSIRFTDQNSQPYGILNESGKEFADKLREVAYEKRSELKKYVPTNQALVQSQPMCPSGIPYVHMQYSNTQATDRGEQVGEVNSSLPSLPPNTRGCEDGQLEAPIVDWDWVNQLLDLAPPEERGDYFEALDNDNVTSKLKAACYVTKAAIMFMFSIQQDSPAPKKKQKVQ